jgi:tripartite-type tricarboxylate transporter receptor subunit TctC
VQFLVPVVIAALAFAWGTSSHPQTYPNRPVRVIVAPAAGGPTDAIVRALASKLTEMWGQQLVVDNRPGAGNTIGPTIASKATPDGYTVSQCGISDAIAPALHQKLPYDLLRDFSPVSLIGTTPNVLVVHPAVPVRSVQEFIAYARANRGNINYASTGVGISTHLSMELFKSLTKTDIVHVPYKAAALAFVDLIAGRVSAQIANLPGQIDNINAGKVRALGVTTLTRNARLPDVPTIAESGVPGFDVTVWYGLCAPAAVPKPIISKLEADVASAVSSIDLRTRLDQLGVDAQAMSKDRFTAFITSETSKWAAVVESAGIPRQ